MGPVPFITFYRLDQEPPRPSPGNRRIFMGQDNRFYEIADGGEVSVWSPIQGEPGASAYELAVERGFLGTEEEWLASLQGADGADGDDGDDGADGADGTPLELQATATHLQQRYVGGGAWSDLVSFATIVASAGITLGGTFTTSGTHNLTLTLTGVTSVTLPTTGTLATLGGSETLSNKTVTGPSATVTGALIANSGNANAVCYLGPWPAVASTYGGLWFGSAVAAPDSSNYTVLVGGGETLFNASASLAFRINNGSVFTVTPTNFSIGTLVQIHRSSAGTPLINFGMAGDTNTGLLSTGEDEIALQAGGVNGLIVKTARAQLAIPLALKSYTVATLPTGVAGDTAYVTDATAPTYLGALTGGGTVRCKVFHNGTAWVSA